MAERELKYVITADDSPFKKTLEKVKSMAANSGKEISDAAETSADKEVAAKQRVIDKVIELGKKSKEVAFEIANNPDPIVNWEPQLSAMDALKAKIKELNAEEQTLSDAFSSGSITNNEFAKSIEGIKKEQEQLNNQMSEANQGDFIDWTKQAKEVKEVVDTIGSLTDQLDKLKSRQEDTPIGPELNQLNSEIQELETNIKQAANAGKVGFDEFGFAIALSKEAVPMLQTELRAVVDEMGRMRVAGKVDTAEYTELTQKASELKKAIKDVNMEIDSGASRTGGLDNAIRSVQTLTAAYSIAQSASMMLGGNNEDLQKQLMKVAAAMSLLQGLQTIQNELKRADSIFTAAQTAAQRAYAIAVGASTGAMKAFRIALASTGVGLLVIALGSLIANFDRVTGAVNKFLPAGRSIQKMFDGIKTYAMGVGEAVFKYIAMPFKAIAAVLRGDLQGFKDAIIEGHSFKSNFTKGVNEQELRTQDAHNAKMEAKAIENEERELERARNRGEANAQAEIDNQKRKLAALIEGSDEYNAQQKKIEDMEDAMYRDANKKVSTRAADAEANKRQALLDKLDDMNTEYLRKSMSQDEQEYQSIVDKYAKMRREIEQFNASVKSGERIDLKGFDKQAEVAIADVRYRQDTTELAVELAKQKLLFQNYESFKTQVSKAEADKRYGAQMAEYDSYEDLLESHQKELYDLAQSRDLTREEVERLKYLNDELDKIRKQKSDKEAQAFAAAFQEAETYNEKLLKAEEKYQLKLIASGGKFSEEQLAILKQKRDDEINAIKEAELQKLDTYKKSGEEILVLTRNQIKEQIKAMRSLLDSGTLKGELKTQIENELKGLEVILKFGIDESNISSLEKQRDGIIKAIEARKKLKITTPENEKELQEMLNKLIEIESKINDINGSGLKEFFASLKDSKELTAISEGLGLASDAAFMLSDALGGVETEGGYTMNTIGELAGAAADLGMAIASGNPVAMIQAGIKAVGTIISIGKKVKEMNAAARKEVADFYDQAIKGEMEYQALLRKREMDEAKRGKTTHQGLVAQLELLKSQSPELKKAYDKIFESLQGGEFVSGKDSKHGTWFRKAKTWDIMASLAGSDYDALEKLDLEGKLKGKEKEDFQTLKKFREELKATGLDIEDIQQQLDEMLTGTSVEGLSNTLADLFANGKMAAEDFGKSLEEILRNAIINGFKYRYLEEAMEPLFDFMAEAGKDGWTKQEVDEAIRMGNAIFEGAKAVFEPIDDLFNEMGWAAPEPSKSGIQNNIERMTEQTGSELTGLFRNQFEVSKSLLLLQQKQWEVSHSYNRTGVESLLAIQANTLRTANNTEHNKRLENMEISLDIIARNSRAGQSDTDLYI